jgi:hypothetical protein
MPGTPGPIRSTDSAPGFVTAVIADLRGEIRSLRSRITMRSCSLEQRMDTRDSWYYLAGLAIVVILVVLAG